MATELTMPKLGLTMEEGTIVKWLAAVGEPITRGSPLLIVESEKSEVEIEAFATGILAAIYVPAGTTVPVGALLGAIVEEGEAFDAESFRSRFQSIRQVPAARSQPPSIAHPVYKQGSPRHTRAQPAARALARKLGVELAGLQGSGPAGRVTVTDVEDAASQPTPSRQAERFGHGPPVCLLPGFAMDRGAWAKQLEALVPAYSAVVFEYRACTQMESLANDVHEMLADLEATPAVLVAASMGAAVALEMTRSHQRDLAGLVLVAPFLAVDARVQTVLSNWAALAEAGVSNELRAALLLPWMLAPGSLEDDKSVRIATTAWARMLRHSSATSLRAHARAIARWPGMRNEDLANIELPVLVVAGAEDVLIPIGIAGGIAKALPNARLEVLAGAGHALMIEAAEQLNELLLAFLADVTGGEAA